MFSFRHSQPHSFPPGLLSPRLYNHDWIVYSAIQRSYRHEILSHKCHNSRCVDWWWYFKVFPRNPHFICSWIIPANLWNNPSDMLSEVCHQNSRLTIQQSLWIATLGSHCTDCQFWSRLFGSKIDFQARGVWVWSSQFCGVSPDVVYGLDDYCDGT